MNTATEETKTTTSIPVHRSDKVPDLRPFGKKIGIVWEDPRAKNVKEFDPRKLIFLSTSNEFMIKKENITGFDFNQFVRLAVSWHEIEIGGAVIPDMFMALTLLEHYDCFPLEMKTLDENGMVKQIFIDNILSGKEGSQCALRLYFLAGKMHYGLVPLSTYRRTTSCFSLLLDLK